MSAPLIDGAAPFQAPRLRRPSNFLSLAPVQSATYPSQPPVSSPKATTPKVESPALEAAPVPSEVPIPHQRADSTSSIASNSQRFLRLGPVFWGGSPEVDDYAVEN